MHSKNTIKLVGDWTDKKSKPVDTAKKEMAIDDKEEVFSFLDEDEPIGIHFSNAGTKPESPSEEYEDTGFTDVFEQLEAEAKEELARQSLVGKGKKEKVHTAEGKSLIDSTKETTKPKKQARGRKAKPNNLKEASVDDKEDDDEEEEYEIDAIVSHRLYRNHVVKYEIHWKGYPDEENTIEAASTIHSDVSDLCAAYWDSLPNITRPLNAPPSKKKEVSSPFQKNVKTSSSSSGNNNNNKKKAELISKKETSTSIKKQTSSMTKKETSISKKKESVSKQETPMNRKEVIPAPSKKRPKKEEIEATSSNKRAKLSREHVPQYMIDKGFDFSKSWPNIKTRWDLDMRKFSAIQLSPIDKSIKMAYIEWNNGERTIHSLEECHQKCPEKLIEFYEERLRFV